MAVTLEQLVQDLSESSVVTSADVSAVVETLPPEKKTAEELAKQLVRQKKLTKFQAQAAFNGKARGLVFGDYVVVDKLGAGGMGVVFKARHRRMKREVALKVLPQKALDSPDAVERFEREVEAAAKLIHANIVIAHDAGESNGKHYLVMEFVDGDDIAAVIRSGGPLPVEKTINYTIQAARGLQFAHDEGVVHRDIKPGNLLLDKKGTVKILDMGLARLHQPASGNDPTQAKGLTQSGQIMGTCEYMAPEQAEDTRSADHRADIYALGCSLYKMLTGKSVYDGQTMIQTLIAHREAEIPSLCDGRDDVPLALDAVFKKMVAKTPDERYQSMSEVILDLETVEASGDLDEVEMMESPPKESSWQTALTSFFQNIKTQDSDATPKAVDATAQVDRSPLESKKKWLLVGGGVAACLIVVGLVFAFWPDGSGEVGLGGGDSFGGDGEANADGQPISDPSNSDPDRAAAQWALGIGGKVTTDSGSFTEVGQLPKQGLRVTKIDLQANRQFTDDDLKHLAGLTELEELSVGMTRISDAGLEHLKALTNLRFLAVNGTVVSDSGLVRLKGLTKLQTLSLSNTQISNTGLEHLKGLTNLTLLSLDKNPVRDTGLEHLKGLTKLTSLSLHTTQVSDVGLEHLKGLTKLTILALGNTQVSDTGLEYLTGMTNLVYLYLNNTQVTDAGLEHVKGLTNLTILTLTNTQVTAEGIAELKKALPNCNITWDDPSNPDPDRAAAEWVLSIGGKVNTIPSSGTGKNQLPNEPFKIKGIHFASVKQLTDSELAELARIIILAEVNGLDLNDTSVGDSGLERLCSCETLTFLTLTSNQITDSGLQHLTGLTKLSSLGLGNNQITDSGLKYLTGLTDLTTLTLTRTQVTAQGVADLKKALPNCRISWDEPANPK